jgi:hypothetical protein
METGVLSGLQLTAMFPNLILENFYTKTKNSIEQGKNQAPYGYIIAAGKDMTKPADLVRILRAQGIEVGQAPVEFKIGETTYGAGSYVIKGGQPYFRLAKNFLEKQDYPDARLQTYDDSGWTMGYAFNVDVKEIRDKSVLEVPAPLVKTVDVKGHLMTPETCDGAGRMAIAHYGSNNMISFRYALRNVRMSIAEKAFKIGAFEAPAGSFIIDNSSLAPGPGGLETINRAVQDFGLTSALFCSDPKVPTHDADAPRIAIYSQWSGTQDLGWYRLTFDNFKIP